MPGKPLNLWQVFKRVDQFNQLVMLVGCVCWAVSSGRLIGMITLGLFGDWQWSGITTSLAAACMGWALMRWVYWEFRALDAEKRLPTSHTWPTSTSMNIHVHDRAALVNAMERERRAVMLSGDHSHR